MIMELKKIVAAEYKHIDILKDEIRRIQKNIDELYLKIANHKKTFEKENSHFIGKKAICSIDGDINFQNVECTCKKIIVTDNFGIKPLFVNKDNKKVSVDFYDWL